MEVPNWMNGRSLRPLFLGEPVRWRKELFVESGVTTAIVTREWKFILWRDGTEELYDRLRDPHDLDNLADDPPLEGVKEMLCRRLLGWASSIGSSRI